MKKNNNSKNYAMFSNSGNNKVARIVKKLKKKDLMPDGVYDYDFFDEHFGKLRKKHPETFDTRVREFIVMELLELEDYQ